MERDAKLFEAGEYPDRGVTVTEAHLDQLVQSFAEAAPVLLEHLAGGWVVGSLTRVWKRGAELFGRVQLLPEAAALIQRLGIRGLSVGLSPDLQRILEVSVTAAPRVADARLWSDACRFTAQWVAPDAGEGETGLDDETMTGTTEMSSPVMSTSSDASPEDPERDALVTRWLQRGRLTPAAAPYARALLGATGAAVRFGDTGTDAATLFRNFMDAMPELDLYSERAMAASDDMPFTAEQREWLSRHWPDVPMDALAEAARKREEDAVWRR